MREENLRFHASQDRYWNIEEAAAYLGKMNPETLRRWCREGRVRYRRAGRLYLFSKEILDRFVELDGVK